MFGANRGVLAYVLKRELALQRKKCDFELEICVIERGGRAARCMGRAPVAHMVASEARRAPPGWPVSTAFTDPSNSLFPGDQSRESCGRVGNSLKLPPPENISGRMSHVTASNK